MIFEIIKSGDYLATKVQPGHWLLKARWKPVAEIFHGRLLDLDNEHVCIRRKEGQ